MLGLVAIAAPKAYRGWQASGDAGKMRRLQNINPMQLFGSDDLAYLRTGTINSDGGVLYLDAR